MRWRSWALLLVVRAKDHGWAVSRGRETELLTHLAAATDIWTALTALPDEEKPTRKPRGCLFEALLGLLALWWCL